MHGVDGEQFPEATATPDGFTFDLSGLAPGAVSRIRVAEPGIDPDGVAVILNDAVGNPVEVGPASAASSTLAADVTGELPESGEYILRIQTVAADEGFVQPNGFAFTYNPAFVTAGGGGSGAPGWLVPVLIGVFIVSAGAGLAVANRRRNTVTEVEPT